MKSYRPIPMALNKPVTVLGIPVFAITASGLAYGLTLLLPLSIWARLLSAGVALLFMVGVKLLVQRDNRFPQIFFRAFLQRARYEPSRRDVFRLEIK